MGYKAKGALIDVPIKKLLLSIITFESIISVTLTKRYSYF
jgi:hypothetical protein